jgi:hypothetical protein
MRLLPKGIHRILACAGAPSQHASVHRCQTYRNQLWQVPLSCCSAPGVVGCAPELESLQVASESVDISEASSSKAELMPVELISE